MKKRRTILVLAVLIAGIAPLVYGVEHTPIPVGSSSKATPSVEKLVGTISSVNAQSLTLSSMDGKSSTIALDSATSAWKMGKTLPVNDLKAGEKVKVRHMTKDGKDVAKSIEVL